MRLKNSKEIDAFKEAISKCKGDVWLETPMGDRYNLKSYCCQYLAIGKLLEDKGDELELFCQLREDDINFFHFFENYPNAL